MGGLVARTRSMGGGRGGSSCTARIVGTLAALGCGLIGRGAAQTAHSLAHIDGSSPDALPAVLRGRCPAFLNQPPLEVGVHMNAGPMIIRGVVRVGIFP